VNRRGPWSLAVLAVVGCGISLYLAAYQLRLLDAVWDPFFGSGSERVLTSPVSRLLPVPDALVGAVAYAVEAVLAALLAVGIGSADVVSGLLVLVACAGALVGIGLAVSQPLIAEAFCSLCLASTVISVVLAGGAVREARRHWITGHRAASGQEVHP
jgi:uncharacterized membrane protein